VRYHSTWAWTKGADSGPVSLELHA